MVTLGERIRSLRHAAGLTLAEVAEGADLSVSYIADIEHGRRVPSLDSLVRIALVFDHDVVSLLRGLDAYDRSRDEA